MDILEKMSVEIFEIESPEYERSFYMVNDNSTYMSPAVETHMQPLLLCPIFSTFHQICFLFQSSCQNIHMNTRLSLKIRTCKTIGNKLCPSDGGSIYKEESEA